jgi:hypothetical protein
MTSVVDGNLGAKQGERGSKVRCEYTTQWRRSGDNETDGRGQPEKQHTAQCGGVVVVGGDGLPSLTRLARGGPHHTKSGQLRDPGPCVPPFCVQPTFPTIPNTHHGPPHRWVPGSHTVGSVWSGRKAAALRESLGCYGCGNQTRHPFRLYQASIFLPAVSPSSPHSSPHGGAPRVRCSSINYMVVSSFPLL